MRVPRDARRIDAAGDNYVPASLHRVLLEGATLIDGTGGAPVPDAAILIEGERLAYCGPRAAFSGERPPAALDLAGLFVIPGLIDLHTHSTFDADMRAYLANGVTSIRFAGLNQDAVTHLRDRIERGDIDGPRIFSCGPMLDMSPSAFPHWTAEVNTPAEAGATARRLLVEDGVEALIATQRITPALLDPIVSSAHALGRPVVGQIWALDGRQAAEIGIDQLDNNSRIFASRDYPPERLLRYDSIAERLRLLARGWASVDWGLTRPIQEAMIQHGVAFCPTLVATQYRAGLSTRQLEADRDYQALFGSVERAAWQAFQAYVVGSWTDADRATMDADIQGRMEWLRRFRALGGTIVVGTDMQFGGITLHAELRNLVTVGLSPLEVISAATGRSAQALRMADDLGTLTPGRLADLVVVRRDPLGDLSALRDVVLVVKGGKVVAGTGARDRRWQAGAE